jgi:hypothetical protein
MLVRHLPSGERPWHWGADVHVGVSFCVWTLRMDGLTVPPFDQHPQGSQALQQVGLTAATWREWVRAVVGRIETVEHAAAPTEFAAAAIAAGNPTTAWPGIPAVREALEPLWQRYERWDGQVWQWQQANTHLLPKYERQVWRALKPYHGRLRTLRVYFVDYPLPCTYLVPPVSLLLGGGFADQAALFSSWVVRGAEELAGAAP